MAANSRGTSPEKKKTTQSGTRKGSGAQSSRTRQTTRSSSKKKKKKKVKSAVFREAALYFVTAFSLILLLSNFGIAGKVGRFFCALQFGTFGVLAYIFPVGLFCCVVILSAAKKHRGVIRIKCAAAFASAAFLCGFIEMIVGSYKTMEKFSEYYNFIEPVKKGGGVVGGALCRLLAPAVGEVGAYIVIVVAIIASAVIISERSILGGIKSGGKKVFVSAKEDLNEYREETEKKRAIRQENRQENRQREREREQKERHSRFTKRVSGVDLSLEIPRENKKAGGAEPELPELGDAYRQGKRGLVAGEVKEVFQNDRYSENILEISAENGGSEEMPVQEIQIEPKRSRPKTVSVSETRTEAEPVHEPEDEPKPMQDASEEAVPAVHEPEDAYDTAAAKADYGGRVQAKRPKQDSAAASGKQHEQLDTEISAEIMQSEERTEKVEEMYHFPPIELLQKGRSGNGSDKKELQETAIKLQQTLSNFGVRVTVSDVSCGPAVTRYEIQPEQGVKVSRIVSLADDIKLNLAASDIRIEAPIPGKAAVGIEVPNRETAGVSLRELIESRQFKEASSPIAFGVGKDIAGQVVVADIAKMPHVLIAGATGSGKSVCINTIIMSILYRAKPSEVKMVMIDPKVVELSIYNGIPHLMIPVVTDSKKAAGALNWAVAEMDDRYKKFAQAGVRDLKGYNAKVEQIKDIEDENKPAKLPQIVIIVDELADLMMVSKNEVEDAIVRLAQLARAAGIHLVIATQRPSVDVITGLIKANVPSRIAFAVSSGVDSRTILDMVGAEKLLGKGDMLFSPAGYPKPARVQGAFVSDNEVSAVVEFLKENCGEAGGYHNDVTEKINNPAFEESQAFGGGYDEYFAEAGRYLIEKGKGSVSILQRVYRIGFNRAARIMDQLEEAGVMGPEEGTKPRKVLMTMEEFENFLQNMR